MAELSPLTIDVPKLDSIYTQAPIRSGHASHQLTHRANIIHFWNIQPGSRVLEIGCGQGDATLVLAAAVGESGHVDAVDPGAEDYGSPMTLGQSQARLQKSELGPRITFHRADPVDYIYSNPDKTYDYVVFCNSLWYFDPPSRITALLSLLHTTRYAPILLISEWSLSISSPSALPHLLAALAHSVLEARSRGEGENETQNNIVSAVSPAWLKECLAGLSWVVEREELIVTPEGLEDGRWEAEAVMRKDFAEKIKVRCKGDERGLLAIEGMRDTVRVAMEACKGTGLGCMDVWVGVVGLGGG